MAHTSQETSPQHQGNDDPGHPWGDRDPEPAASDPTMPPGVLVTPPPRGGDDDDEQ